MGISRWDLGNFCYVHEKSSFRILQKKLGAYFSSRIETVRFLFSSFLAVRLVAFSSSSPRGYNELPAIRSELGLALGVQGPKKEISIPDS